MTSPPMPSDLRAVLLDDLAQVGELLDVEVLPCRVLPRRLRDLLAELDAVAPLAAVHPVVGAMGTGGAGGEIEAVIAPQGATERLEMLRGELRDLWGEWLFTAGALVGWEARGDAHHGTNRNPVSDAVVLRVMCDAADSMDRRDGWESLRRDDS